MDLETMSRRKAMEELTAMRKAITSVERVQETQIETVAFQVNRSLQFVTLILCVGMIFVEIFVPSNITRSLIKLKGDGEGLRLAVASLAAFLIVCVTANYLVIFKAAGKSGEGFLSFCRRNFSYLSGLSHAFDLLIKFIVTAMVIWAGRPEWVAPLLFFFTGDYLIAGRFFTLNGKVRMGLALVSLLLGGFQLSIASGFLLWPLLWFSFLTVISIVALARLEKVDE